MNFQIFLICAIIVAFTYHIFINIIKSRKLKDTLEKLSLSELHNKTLKHSYDGLRTFRHDFFNILEAIHGYIETGDMEGLKEYYKEIHAECISLNNLACLTPDFIDEPALYKLIVSKYYKAQSLRHIF